MQLRSKQWILTQPLALFSLEFLSFIYFQKSSDVKLKTCVLKYIQSLFSHCYICYIFCCPIDILEKQRIFQRFLIKYRIR